MQHSEIHKYFCPELIQKISEKGSLLGREVEYSNYEDTLDKIRVGVCNINALALETGFTTKGSLQHLVSRVSKGLAYVAFSTSTDVAALANLIELLKEIKVKENKNE